ncbi:CGNR zinc finger domain-containing protein [Amycolatopsis sp.]|uniref:CGNR zinc finger domain-containing protein n=1 Tax=Amycolatopsis sp. TaxID=37632 RepID=UPI002DFDFE1A|nr:CGNR zinc finger domain-containing protein [Amycolatopsis sp.]
MSVQPAQTGDASLVVDFLNTFDIEEKTDLLTEPAQWRRWAAERGLKPDPISEALEVRDALRASVGDPRLPAVATRTAVHIELTLGGPVLAADNVVGAVLAAAARLAVLEDWRRVKICPADDCLWAFFDHSRNRSRTWCSMSACGNREKARAWRARAVEPVDRH